MDPFTQRMLERARARREKIDAKLANSGQPVPKRQPLTENQVYMSNIPPEPVDAIASSGVRVKSSVGSDEGDLAVEINIVHAPDVHLEVQVEHHNFTSGNPCVEIREMNSTDPPQICNSENINGCNEDKENYESGPLRNEVKNRLHKLGKLYSGEENVQSPVHRTEENFSAGTPPTVQLEDLGRTPRLPRLQALAKQINSWEDDTKTDHRPHPKAQENTRSEKSESPVKHNTGTSSNKQATSPVRSWKLSAHQSPKKETGSQNQITNKFGTSHKSHSPSSETNSTEKSIPSQTSSLPSKVSAIASKWQPKTQQSPVKKKPFIVNEEEKKRHQDESQLDVSVHSLSDINRVLDAQKTKDQKKLSAGGKELQRQLQAQPGSVLARAAHFEAAAARTPTLDPADLPLRDRRALFENRHLNPPVTPAGTCHSGSSSSLHTPQIAQAASMNSYRSQDRLATSSQPRASPRTPGAHEDEEDIETEAGEGAPLVTRPPMPPPAPPTLPPKPAPEPRAAPGRDVDCPDSDIDRNDQGCGSSEESDEEPAPAKRGALDRTADWADTSLGRELLQVVRRNKAQTTASVSDDSDGDDSDGDRDDSDVGADIDELLDDALRDSDEEPTPPKLNKCGGGGGGVVSRSFKYGGCAGGGGAGGGVGGEKAVQFQSPLKSPVPRGTPRKDPQLVHTVSFYRRANANGSASNTPVRRIVLGTPGKSAAAEQRAASAGAAVPVRERIRQLQAEAGRQAAVMGQASAALNLCDTTAEFSNSREKAEGERLLLVAAHRRQAALHEAQRLQVEGAGGAGAGECAPTLALSLTRLGVAVRREYLRALASAARPLHRALLLLKCRERVLATDMPLTDTPHLHFPDSFRIDNLHDDFKVTIEVYLLEAERENLPHDVKYHIGNKKSGRELKAVPVSSPGGPGAVRTPQFALHGYCIFGKHQLNRTSFTLSKVPADSPLEGSLSVKVSWREVVGAPEPAEGFLTFWSEERGLGAWHRRYAALQPPFTHLHYWKYPDDAKRKAPIGSVDLSAGSDGTASMATHEVCVRAHSIVLEWQGQGQGHLEGHGRRLLLAADTAEDAREWLHALDHTLRYLRASRITTDL